jgi:hypothetical protein
LQHDKSESDGLELSMMSVKSTSICKVANANAVHHNKLLNSGQQVDAYNVHREITLVKKTLKSSEQLHYREVSDTILNLFRASRFVVTPQKEKSEGGAKSGNGRSFSGSGPRIELLEGAAFAAVEDMPQSVVNLVGI